MFFVFFFWTDVIDDNKPTVSVWSPSFTEPHEKFIESWNQAAAFHMSTMSAPYHKRRNRAKTCWRNHIQVMSRYFVVLLNEFYCGGSQGYHRIRVVIVRWLQIPLCFIYYETQVLQALFLPYTVVLMLRCRHSCHTDCIRNEFGETTDWSCPICSKKNITSRASSAEDQPSVSTQNEVTV